MGRESLPATVMNVKMCCAKCEEKAKEECEEVEGVLKVVTDQSESKVIVYGPADPDALLKKMRRHLDRHAMFWRIDGDVTEEVAPPLFLKEPSETGRPLSMDHRDGSPLGESREIHPVQREMKDAEIRERGSLDVGPREVVFIPVDAKDGTAVDPRTVRKVEPGDERPPLLAREFHPLAEREMIPPADPRENPAQVPREVVFIPVDAKDGTPVDPRRVQVIDSRDGTYVNPRDVARPLSPSYGRPDALPELRPVNPPRLGLPGSPRGKPMDPHDVQPFELREVRPGNVSDLRQVDPGMMRPASPREMQRMDPHIRPVDPRIVERQIDMRDGRAYGPPPDEPPRRVGVPEGLVPIRTAPHSREVNFVPVDHRVSQTNPGRGDPRPRSPREIADRYMARDLRVVSDYGPRSPRDGDYGPRSPRDVDFGPRRPRDVDYAPPRGLRTPEYAPRSPREAMDYNAPRSLRGEGFSGPPRSPGRPVLDRELSFNDYGPSGAPRAVEVPRVPMPYEPLDPREADAFDFRGGPGAQHHVPPRSPRGTLGGVTLEPVVRGYGDIDPRRFKPAEPRVLLDVTKELAAADLRDRDYDALDYRSRGLESPRRQYSSNPNEFRSGESHPREYQPRESVLSDYQPSQDYQPGPLASQVLDDFPITNPNYKKQIGVGPEY